MALEREQLAIEVEQLDQEELAVFVDQMNASKQEVEQLKDALTEAVQEVVNLRDSFETVQWELDVLRSEGSRTSVSRISDAFGRRATLMRSNGDWTMTGVLQTLKKTPKISTTYSPDLQ